jgi:hypothetical protein
MSGISSFRHLSDAQLSNRLSHLVSAERHATAELVACLEEFDRRRLHLALGFSSLYAFCQKQLQLGEGAAYRRIEVARATRRCPQLLHMLKDGRLSLATACLIAPKLGGVDAPELLQQAAYKSKREVELLMATRYPRPPVPSAVRKLPQPRPVAIQNTSLHRSISARTLDLVQPQVLLEPPSRPAVVAPLSESRYKLQVTISSVARERLAQIQDLMRHRLPSGDPAAIIEQALQVLHAELLKRKAAEVAKPRTGKRASGAEGRYIPAAVKREVWRRDGGALRVHGIRWRQVRLLTRRGIPSCAAVRRGRPGNASKHRAALPGAQRIRMGAASRRRDCRAHREIKRPERAVPCRSVRAPV